MTYLKETRAALPGYMEVSAFVGDQCVYNQIVHTGNIENARDKASRAIHAHERRILRKAA